MGTLKQFEEHAYAALRFMSGWMFAFHGAQKILGVFAESAAPFGTQIWIGGLIELLGGIAIAVGFQTRWAAFFSSGTMAVAYVQFHWKFQFDSNFLPGINRGEMAVIYCFVFLLIACRGDGKWSLGKD
jgi:putative oxidoreductase